MSTTHPTEVGCPHCGTRQRVMLAESANVQRSPSWRHAVLDGSFHRFTCEGCALPFRVERDTLYSDLSAGFLIAVFSPTRRAECRELEETIAGTWARTIEIEAPAAVRAAFVGPGPRVVFGLAALREKVVCFDHQLDDRLVEAAKLALLEGIPGRAEAGVTDLVLVAVDEAAETMVFQPIGADGVALGEHLVQAPMAMMRDLDRTRAMVQALLPELFEGLWVHWSRSRPDGLASATNAGAAG
jgi:hypothetical protein